ARLAGPTRTRAQEGSDERAALAVGAVAAQDRDGLVVAVAGLDGDEGAAGLDLAVVVAGLLLRDAQPDQSADQPAGGGAGRGARGGRRADGRQQAAGEDRAEAGNQAHRQGAQHAAEDAAGHRAGDAALGGLRLAQPGALFRRLLLLYCDTDLVVAE